MPIISIDITVECAKCGKDLNVTVRNNDLVECEPCEQCMNMAKDEGYNKVAEKVFNTDDGK